jgi:hypothetical protein
MQIYYSINSLQRAAPVKERFAPDTLDNPNNAPAGTVRLTPLLNLYRINDAIFILEIVTK